MTAGIRFLKVSIISLRQEYERINASAKNGQNASVETGRAFEKVKKDMIEVERDLEYLKLIHSNKTD